ncbi:MAG: pyridoxal-phosphate dependent enzyme, partial [Brumimicrobium sp.]
VNAILQLTDEQKRKGVVTHSSGNFAQALSLAAKSVGVPAYIVIPSNAPRVKINAVKSYGGNISICPATLIDRIKTTENLAKETGATFIHPSNDFDVILGQGTAAKELLESQPNLDIIVTPVGGGGLIAGTAIAAKYYGDLCQVIGAEPSEVDDAYRSLISGEIETNSSTNTIADGLKTNLGDINFPIIQNEVEKIVLVEEKEIIEAMRIVWERMKIVIEPSSAVAFAAVLKEPKTFKNKQVGIIVSGGNVDLSEIGVYFN